MKNSQNLFMTKQIIKKKYIFLGDVDSINIEIIIKSFNTLKNKVKYIIICDKNDLINSEIFKKTNLLINEIIDPINFLNYNKNNLNIFNVEGKSKKKYLKLLKQIEIANSLANITKYDLITMPINKFVFKKEMKFTGMTEYFGKINNKFTIMLMHGDKFSVIPLTTHINLKNVYKHISPTNIKLFLNNFFKCIDKKIYGLKFKEIKFLCYNPHCGEAGTLGKEDFVIEKIIKKNNKIKGIYSADNIFSDINLKSLFISTYHDQVLIPFKLLNNKSINFTLGLNFRRLSPAHGTARDIKKKFIADNTSYLSCLLF